MLTRLASEALKVGRHWARKGSLPKMSQKLRTMLEYHGGLDANGNLIYDVVKANGLVFFVDKLKPTLVAGEQPVFPHHDEAKNLLKHSRALHQKFNTVADPFSGGGHSSLPFLAAGIAGNVRITDINARATHLALLNAKINGLEKRVSIAYKDVTKGVTETSKKTLFIANPPFALTVQNVKLDLMRAGGENGLKLTTEYLKNARNAAKPGDVIIGLAYSRIAEDGTPELEGEIKKHLAPKDVFRCELIKGAKLWREHDGVKRQDNPMPMTALSKKANPGDAQAIASYDQAAKAHEAQGYPKLGYFKYKIVVGNK